VEPMGLMDARMEHLTIKQFGVPDSGPIPRKLYLHGDKDRMYEIGEEMGLSGEALRAFAYTATEVELDVLVHRETGRAAAVKINGATISFGVPV
jgi:hypothetical protein